jgi:hypothetical protein
MSKYKYFRNKSFFGAMSLVLLGLLILNAPLLGIASFDNTDQVPTQVPTDGSPVTLEPGKSLSLETPSGVGINLVVGESVDISVIESSDLPAEAGELPAESYGLGLYLSIELSDPSVEVDATLSMPFDITSLPTDVAAEELAFAFYDAATGEWRGVPSWVDTAEGKVYGKTDHFSTWTVMQNPPLPIPEMPTPGVPFEVPTNGSPVELVPGEKLMLTTPSGVAINLTVGEGVTISINETTINPVGVELPEATPSLGVYLDIELNDSVDVEATLAMPFSDGDLPPGVAKEQLQFAFYDAATGEWTGVPSWVEGNTVYANTTHFSTWTVIASSDDGAEPSTTSARLTQWLGLDIENVKDGFVGLSLLFSLIFVATLVRVRGKH